MNVVLGDLFVWAIPRTTHRTTVYRHRALPGRQRLMRPGNENRRQPRQPLVSAVAHGNIPFAALIGGGRAGAP